MPATFCLSDTILGFIINGRYDKVTIEKIQIQVCEKLEIYDKVSVYIEDTSDADISFKGILQSFPFKIKNANSFEKVAIVTDRKRVRILGLLNKLFINAEQRHFSSAQRLEAIQWISH